MTQRLFLVSIFLFINYLAQAQTASVKGKITDKASKAAMSDVAVQLLGTDLGAFTDAEGNFLLENVTPGTYQLISTFVSYKEDTTKIVVKAGEVLTQDVALSMISTNVVTIVGTVQKQSSGAIILAQKQAVTIMTGISLDEIKKTPDRNTSDVLKRLSGVSVQDNKFVVIRGLSDRYNAVTLNGLPLSSTEPDRRAFSFDLFPAALLDNLTISKTAVPNLTGEFAGGVINLNTKEIPEEPFVSFTVSGGHNSQSTFKPYLFYKGGKWDNLGINDGSRNLPANLPNTDSMKVLLSGSADSRYTTSRLLPNTWGFSQYKSMLPTQNYQFSAGKEFKIGEHSLGVIGALNYSNQWRTTQFVRQDFDIDTTRRFNYDDQQYRQNVNFGGIANVAWKFGKGNKIYTNNLLTFSGDDRFVERNGTDYSNERIENSNLAYYTAYSLRTHQLLGEHTSKKGGIKIKWGTGYNVVNRTTPDMRRMFYTKNLYAQGDKNDSIFKAFVPNFASPSYSGRFYSDQKDVSISGNLDINIDYKLLKQTENKLRFGAAVQTKDKSFDARVFGYRIPNAGTHNYDLEYLSQDAIFAPENMSKQGYSLQEITSKSDSYTASGDTYSGYLMAEQKITKNFRAILGARIESYRQIINSQTFGGDTINVDTTITNILPSINLVYALNEKSNLRLSGSQTVSRPIFRELSPFSFFDFELNAAIQGNDTLTTTKITNVDARYEWFPGLNQLLAVTLFYKDFQKPIEQITDKGSTTTLYTFINTPRATAYGAELEFRAKWTALRYLVEWKQWENFSIYGNFAYVQSRVDQSNIPGIGEKYRQMQGQSPYIINTGINYTNAEKGTSVTLSFNRIGRRLWSVGTTGAVGNRYLEIWEAPRSVLDIQLSQKVFKNGEIKLNIADLLNQRLNFYQDVDGNGKFTKNSTDKLIIGTTFGWNSSLGFSYKF